MGIETRGLAPLLQVFDMPASLRFYRDQVGFKKISDSGRGDDSDWVLLELNGQQLMLNTRYERDNRPDVPDAGRVAAHDDVSIYFSCPNVDAAYEHLRSAGVEINPPSITAYGFKAISIKDPDGFALVFHWRLES